MKLPIGSESMRPSREFLPCLRPQSRAKRSGEVQGSCAVQ